MSKAFDKEVEVCGVKPDQNPDWSRAQRTIMKIDTQCTGANYISSDLVQALNLTPVTLDRPMVIKGIGEERIIINKKVQISFRKIGETKEYSSITFCVLKGTQGFGLLLGTPGCLELDVVNRAVLVLQEVKEQGKWR